MSSEYDNIPSLTSIGSYSRMDTEFVSKGDQEKCSKYNKVSREHSKPYLLCLRLTGNLNNYEELNFFEEMNSYKCNYLNLWAYYQLSKFEEEERSNIRALIIDNWRESEKYEICDNTQFVFYLARDADYIKAKRLYDYALNYYKLKERHDDYDIACNSKEDQYIRESIQLYKGINAECEGNKNELISYCKAYNVIQKIHPDDRLLKLQCKKVEYERESSRVDSIGPGGAREGHRLQGKFTETSSFDLPAPEVASSSGSQQAMAASIPILGISSIFFLLYKFTGLGPMARNLLRTKGINGMNSHEELTHELLESTYDDQALPGITETYIGYQAT
ncbi:PIR Superfamily Protein [Plasmodium ovale curtisi]|uniref:PIR Superfamily Protein n=1 Tax=Plasmodium ovale curtisi TaxID=864141 RepID=A0A1A8WNW0_PLAOA|nr:PIR Superfamily Protein [Plasmodium ovale curtisi]